MPTPIPSTYEIRDAIVATEDGPALRPLELRAATDAHDGIAGYDGYISTWNTVDSYGTFFTKGAFRKTIKERAAIAPVLWQHWPDDPIGTHLTVREDATGVFVQTKLIEGVRRADEALSLLRGDVKLGLSFGFQTIKDRSATDEDDIDLSVAPAWAKTAPRSELRAITEIALWESSPVTFASNERAAPSKVRALTDPDALYALLDALRAGTLSEEQRAACEQLVAAWQDRAGAGAGATHSTPPTPARRTDVEAILALARYRELISGVAA